MFCNKCKQVPPREGDTWCLACSAWESIGISLTGRWGSAGLRGSAAEAVVGTARVLKSLRDIDAGLVARAKSEASRPRSLAVKEEEEETEKKRDRSRSPLIRAKSAAPAVPEREKEEYSEGSESEEASGEEAPTVPAESAVDGRRGHLRPAEPAFPPRNPRGEEAAERDHKVIEIEIVDEKIEPIRERRRTRRPGRGKEGDPTVVAVNTSGCRGWYRALTWLSIGRSGAEDWKGGVTFHLPPLRQER